LREPLDENTSRTLNIIRSSSRHLEKIINDILDFSKLDDGKVVLEQVHFGINEVVQEVYSMFDDQARKNNTALSCTVDPATPPVLLGDPYRLKQIMINLVSNSVKFTRDGTVHIAVKGIRKEHPALILAMEFVDTGIGIDEDKIDTIFEDFTQEEMSTTRKYGGTGLGLSIVRKLVDLQKGTIECRSRKNIGTTIRCEIPFLEGDSNLVNPEAAGMPLVVPEEVRKLRVLVVDDELYNRMLFRSILTRWGVEYAEASDGMEALDIIRSQRFNLLLMDLRMPHQDGVKTTEIIRNELNISGSDLPVICVTAAFTGEDMQNFREAGMNAFLRKPFSEEALLEAILEVTGYERKFAVKAETEREPGRIDLGNLLRAAGGDERFVREMLVTFLEGTEKGLGLMTEYLDKGDMISIADIAHRIIPQCRHLGAVELSSLLKEVETASSQGSDPGKVELLLGRIGEVYPGVRKEIEEKITKIG
jgi:CheY-like chemotaxis protein/HPt (histidine-containing phosphotransfer) domain-containing protein